MGLYVRLYAQCSHIDPERWEALYLTTLQLLERFPAPLVRLIAEPAQGVQRLTLTTQIRSELGTPEEHWSVDGDLGSRRLAETYCLYRHLDHYRAESAKQRRSRSRDILWVPDENLHDAEAHGWSIFDAKSQGYPYHYAMLAVGLLLENALPGRVVVMGDINREQAERVLAWTEAVFQRRLDLPVVMDGARLWQRLAAAYPKQPASAVGRFFALYAEGYPAAWRALLVLQGGPDADTLRRVFVSQLEPLKSLQTRGALQLLAALCEADDGVARVLGWVCGPGPDGEPARYQPEDLLKALCACWLTIPRHEREVLDCFREPSRALGNIDDTFAHVAAILAGAPIVADLFLDEDALLVEFVARWPEREATFREILHAETERQRRFLASWQALEQQASAEQLRCLTVLALIPEPEIRFWEWRLHLLESPDLWPLLCEA
jgi:hypothetical protein